MLYFIYSTMNSGKSTQLLQMAFNYKENNKKVLIAKSAIDRRSQGKVTSRLGIESEAVLIHNNKESINEVYQLIKQGDYGVVFVDEAQFLSKEAIAMLCDAVDGLDIDIFAFGLKTDYKGKLFTGSKALLESADVIQESITNSICHCGRKATYNGLMVGGKLCAEDNGSSIQIGDVNKHNESDKYYITLCRKHYMERIQ